MGASGLGLTQLLTGIVVDGLFALRDDERVGLEAAAESTRAELWSAWRSLRSDAEVEVAAGPDVEARVLAAVEELAGSCGMSFAALAARKPVVDTQGAYLDFENSNVYGSLHPRRFPLRVAPPAIGVEEFRQLRGARPAELASELEVPEHFEILDAEDTGRLTFNELCFGLLRLRGALPRSALLQHELLTLARRQVQETAAAEDALGAQMEREFDGAKRAFDARLRTVRAPQAKSEKQCALEPAPRPAWEARALSRLGSLTQELGLLIGDAEAMRAAPPRPVVDLKPPTACTAAQTERE